MRSTTLQTLGLHAICAKTMVLLCSLGGVLAACSQLAPKIDPTSRKPVMPALESTLEFSRSEVVVGESFPLRLLLRNTNSTSVEVPSLDGPEELEFVLRRAGESNVFAVLNANEARARRSVDPIKSSIPKRDVLAAGATATYHDDPSSYLLQPLPPGGYTLSVAFGAGPARFESRPVPLQILPPMFEAVAAIVQPDAQRISWCVSHRQAPKGSAVLASISPMNRASVGVVHRVADVAAPATVAGVAAAIEAEEGLGETWIAWLQGDALVAGIHEGGSFKPRAETEPLGLRQAALHRVGWRLSLDAASFAVLGLNAENRLVLALVTFAHTGAPSVKRIAVAGTKVPAFWRLGYRASSVNAPWTLVFAETSGNSARIGSQLISAGRDSAEPAVTLLEHAGPVAAFGFSPTETARQVVDVLFGPLAGDPKESKLKLVRATADVSTPPVGQWEFPVPVLTDGGVLAMWTIADAPQDNPIVLVKAGARLLTRRSSAKDWTVLAEQSGSAQHAQVLLIGTDLWASWSDRVSGLRLQFLR